jgi:hypothetical protein
MTDKELIHKQDTYRRPLIETILYIKLQGEGVANSDKQSDVSAAFQISDLKTLYKDVDTNFDKTINSIAAYFVDIMGTITASKKETTYYVSPSATYNVDQNQSLVQPTEKGDLDKQEERIAYLQTINKTILSLFEFNDVAGLSFSRNLTDTSLANSLISILSPEPLTSGSTKTAEDIALKRNKANKDVKIGFRGLDLLLGTFSGISGVDIVVTLYALFKMDYKDIVGLLNDSAKTRLKDHTGASVDGASSAETSIKKLQDEITKIFTKVDEAIKNTLKANKAASNGGK